MAADTLQDRYARKGANEPTEAMLSQAEYSIELANLYKTQLVGGGFEQADIDEMVAKRAELASLLGEQKKTKDEGLAATRAEAQAIEDAKDYLFVIRKVIRRVIRKSGLTDITVDNFSPKAHLGRKVSAFLGHLERIRPHVARLEEVLKPCFGGESPLVVHDRVHGELSRASTSQEIKLDDVPEKTRQLYTAKGRLLELIEEMNAIGTVVFRRRAEIAARFNKDILLRARRARAGGKGPGPATGSEEKESASEAASKKAAG